MLVTFGTWADSDIVAGAEKLCRGLTSASRDLLPKPGRSGLQQPKAIHKSKHGSRDAI